MDDMQNLSITELLKRAKTDTCDLKATDYASQAFNKIYEENPLDQTRAREALESMITHAQSIHTIAQKWDHLTNAFLFSQAISAEDLTKKVTQALIKSIDCFGSKETKEDHLESIKDCYLLPEWKKEMALWVEKKNSLSSSHRPGKKPNRLGRLTALITAALS